jgi:Icc-related predicted phosphoesterase
MPTIAVFGDIHDHQERLDASLRMVEDRSFDLALLAGDVGADPPFDEAGRRELRGPHDESVRRTVDRVAQTLLCPVLFVPGNHDLPDPPGDARGVNCDGRRVEAAGISIAGFGGAGPTRFGFPYEWSEDEADRSLARLLEGSGPPDILLSHSPPSACALDRTVHGDHVGSTAVRSWIGRARPRLMVCGHIHEAWGVERIEDVPCLNAGGLGEPFGGALVWVVEWDEGGPARAESFRRTGGRRRERRVWPVGRAT